MTSPLLALFVRSLSHDAYGKATYWARAGLCGLTVFLLLMILLDNGWAGAPGLDFFVGVIILQMVAISLVGLSYFGSAIAEEKEEQTLGLLRMTDLSPLSILFGKSTSRLCGALLLLAAAFPFTVFAVTLGGVTLGQIIAIYCTLGAYTFLLCNVALLGSVLARHTAGAATFTVIVIGGLCGIGPLLEALDRLLQRFGVRSELDSIADMLWLATPIARSREILTTGFSGAAAGWREAGALALGTGCFFLAWAAFGRFCDRAPGEAGRSAGLMGWRRRRPPRPTNHPIRWKEYHFLCGGNLALALRVCGYLVAPVAVIAPLIHNDFSSLGDVVSTLNTWITIIFYVDTGAMAGRMFRSELNDQTLSALALLPGTIRQIAYRKARALILVAAPGAISSTGMSLFQYGAYHPTYYYGPISLPVMITLQGLSRVATAVLFVHLVIWFSLIVKRGALPIGIVTTLVFFVVVGLTCASAYRFLPMPSFVVINCIVTVLLSATLSFFLHLGSLRRLEALAGEG